MPKFKSVVVRERQFLPNGNMIEGETALVGLDDAAKVTELHKSAIARGIHVPADPKEVENAQKRLDEAEAKENRRRGM